MKIWNLRLILPIRSFINQKVEYWLYIGREVLCQVLQFSLLLSDNFRFPDFFRIREIGKTGNRISQKRNLPAREIARENGTERVRFRWISE